MIFRNRKVFSRIGLGLFLFMLVQQVFIVVINGLVRNYVPQLTNSGWYYWLLVYGSLYLIAFPVMYLIFKTIPDYNDTEKLTKSPALSGGTLAKIALGCIGIAYALNFATTLLSLLIEQLKGSSVENPLESITTGGNPWINILFIVVVAPFFEELIFREFLYRKLMPFGGKIYIFFSAFVFAMFHANLYQIFYAFALGVIFAGIRYYTGRLDYTIILHVIVNFVGSGVAMLLQYYVEGDAVLMLWGFLMLLTVPVGLGIANNWWRRNKHLFHMGEAEISLSRTSEIFVNPGMILFILAMSALTIFNVIY